MAKGGSQQPQRQGQGPSGRARAPGAAMADAPSPYGGGRPPPGGPGAPGQPAAGDDNLANLRSQLAMLMARDQAQRSYSGGGGNAGFGGGDRGFSRSPLGQQQMAMQGLVPYRA